MFNEKILALFVNFYGGGLPIDHDNLEIKHFIDGMINRVIIKDDSPECLDILFTGVIDRNIRRHTEVYAGKTENVMKMYKKIHAS